MAKIVKYTLRSILFYSALLACLVISESVLYPDWLSPVRLTTNNWMSTTSSGNQSDLIMDSQGNLHLVWLDDRDHAGALSEVYYKKYSSQSGWGLDYRLTYGVVTGWDDNNNPIIDQQDKALPGIVADQNGNLYVSYENSTTQTVQMVRFETATNIWNLLPVEVGNGGISSINPVMAVDSNNHVHAVWRTLSAGVMQVQYRKYIPGYGWGLIENITSAVSEKQSPMIVVDSSDTIHVAWADSRDTTGPVYFEIYYCSKPSAGTWSNATRLSVGLGSDSLNPFLAPDGSNNLHLVWEDNRDGNFEIYYRQWQASASAWTAEQRLTSEAAPSRNPRVVVDPSLQIQVVWDDGRYLGGGWWNQYSLYYKRKTAFWGDDTRLSGKGCRASIVADSASNLHVAFMAQFESIMNPEIFYIKFDPTQVSQPVPRELVIALDVSGSMSWKEDGTPSVVPGDTRLYKAGQAISSFLDRFALRNPRDISFGLVTFPNSMAPCPSAANVIPGSGTLWPLNDANRKQAISTIIPGLTAGGGTPMVEGLTLANSLLNSTTTVQMLLLASDGCHNCPGQNFPAGFLATISAPVYTVGIGTSVEVDLPRLNTIAQSTGGEFRDATTSTQLNLMSWFKTIIQNRLSLEAECDPSAKVKSGKHLTHKVWITDHDRDIAFDISWSRPGERYLEFSLLTPDGTVISPESAAELEGITYISRPTYQIYFLREEFLKGIERAGQWAIEVDGPREDTDSEETYHYGVLMESDLKLCASFDKNSYVTNEPMSLQVEVREGKKRLPATIRVRVQRPRQSAANWMVRHRVDPKSLDNIADPDHGDPLSGIQRKARLLRGKMEKPFSTDPQQTVLILHDDGTNGDLKANDLIYTSIVSLTRLPGTYILDITAVGTTGAGQPFRRELVIQKYLLVKPEQESTIFKLEQLDADSRSYQVTVFPRDGLGNYLGPGFGEQIHFSIRGARLVGTIRDHLNGGYSQRFQIPVSAAEKKLLIKARILGIEMIFCL